MAMLGSYKTYLAAFEFVKQPDKVAVTIGNWQKFGRLPLTEWGRVEW